MRRPEKFQRDCLDKALIKGQSMMAKKEPYTRPRTPKEIDGSIEVSPEVLGLGLTSDSPEGAKREQSLHRARARRTSEIRQAREDPKRFMEYCFRDDESGKPIVLADIHIKVQDAMADESIKDLIIEMSRDHGKTSNAEAHVLWRLGNNPNLRIKFVSANDSKATERLFAITQHLEQNSRVHDVFPWLKPANKGSWTNHKIVVDRNRIGMRDASVEAVGVLATATGGRCDFLVADDVVDRRNALELPKLRSNIKVAWDSDWSNIMEPDAQTVWICTPWHTDDCTAHLKAKGVFHHLRFPVGPNCEPVWDAKWPKEKLEERRRKIGRREFDRAFRLLALSGEFATVSDEIIKYWKEPPRLDELVVFTGFDVSTGGGEDFSASVAIGVSDPDSLEPSFCVLDAWHDQQSLLQQIASIDREAASWFPLQMGIEATAYQAVLPQISAELNPSLPLLVPLKPRISKALRLSAVTPYLERGQVLFNPVLEPARVEKERGDLVTELTTFPLGIHDDLVDAFVHALTLAVEYVLKSRRTNQELRTVQAQERHSQKPVVADKWYNEAN